MGRVTRNEVGAGVTGVMPELATKLSDAWCRGELRKVVQTVEEMRTILTEVQIVIEGDLWTMAGRDKT